MNFSTTCSDFYFLLGAFDGRYHLDESHWTGTGRGPFTIAPLRAPPVKQRQTWGVKMMRGDGVGGFTGFPISPILPAQNKKH